ncbi:Adenylosuccinate synthetase (plasmid) [Tsukamurella tyrosinosolvens]|uniref:Adenylosuccinate synthetase n=1 Tax=Tsukamurella tyrosinosolvens TaxID=57704 RepID=A0A1H4ULA6_TSUTY|nr:adenylosuccinate synthetase [Tsukamurella tyrosinosolvens]KXO99058.1 adenylosuccinate synthetase [Tsukamurella tyrosinosolvens]SEC69453.1 adenylosuccinate synthase [Tsukamurella tyrosinosolvens]VEH94327.1 Adenylosuccinate synthetase [Tsukamurella tyrosinosolvens]
MPAHPHTIVVGLGFGDEAKGATVAHLAATTQPATVVRFNGGAQTAHNVVDGARHHTFRLFGSGTFAGTPTYLSRHVLVDPWMLAAEAEKLRPLGVNDPLSLVTVSPDALIATPIHRAANRTREELRGGNPHGSCGLGIGETRWYSLAHAAGLRAGRTLWEITADIDADEPPLTVADCQDAATVRARLTALEAFYGPLLARGPHTLAPIDEMVETLVEFGGAVGTATDAEYLFRTAQRGHLLFEGAQGVLLDEWRGLHPHTTWSTTLPSAAQELLAEAGLPPAEVVGVLRTYATRHGHGPLPTEDEQLRDVLPEPHNGAGRYQGGWRVGHVDLPLVRYAAHVCRQHGGLDALSISHLDTVAAADGAVMIARAYGDTVHPYGLGLYRDLAHQERLTAVARTATPRLEPVEPSQVPHELARAAGAPALITATGPDTADRVQELPLGGERIAA